MEKIVSGVIGAGGIRGNVALLRTRGWISIQHYLSPYNHNTAAVSSSSVVPTMNTTPRSATNTEGKVVNLQTHQTDVCIHISPIYGDTHSSGNSNWCSTSTGTHYTDNYNLLQVKKERFIIIIMLFSEVVHSKPPSARHVYEDVPPSMSFNPRYLAHKLNISEAASSDVCDGVQWTWII